MARHGRRNLCSLPTTTLTLTLHPILCWSCQQLSWSLPCEADYDRNVTCYPKDEWSDLLISVVFLIPCAKYIQPIWQNHSFLLHTIFHLLKPLPAHSQPNYGPSWFPKGQDFSSLRQLKGLRERSPWTEKIVHFRHHLTKHRTLNWTTKRARWMILYSLSTTVALETTDGISSCLVWGNLEKLTHTDIRIGCIRTTFANSELCLGREGSSLCFLLLTTFISARKWKTPHRIISNKLAKAIPALASPSHQLVLPRVEIAPAVHLVLRRVLPGSAFAFESKI